MRAARLALVVTSLSLLAPLTVVTSTSAGAAGQAPAQASAPVAGGRRPLPRRSPRSGKKKGSSWTPPVGCPAERPDDPRSEPQHPAAGDHRHQQHRQARVHPRRGVELRRPPGHQCPARGRPPRRQRADRGGGVRGERQLGPDPHAAQRQDHRQELRAQVHGRLPQPDQDHAREVHPLQPDPQGEERQHVRFVQPDHARRQPAVERHGDDPQLRSLQRAGADLQRVRQRRDHRGAVQGDRPG